MSNRKNTKRALLTSCVSMLLCASMLVGSTFAWFTDTDTVAVNKVVSGNLDVEIVDENGDELKDELTFQVAEGGTAAKDEEENILWEPGATFRTQKFQIKNNGNLALKFKVEINNTEVSYNKLNEVIDWSLVDATNNTKIDLAAMEQTPGHLKAGETYSSVMYLEGTMQTTAGNGYMNLTMDGVAITVYATQDTVESDSDDNQYDADATFSGKVITVNTADEFVKAFSEVKGNETIVLNNNIDMTGKAWNPVMNKGFTLDGNGYTVKGLNGGLVDHTGTASFTIKDITFDRMVDDSTTNYAGLIADADTCSYINMENVTISHSTIKSAKYAAGFAAYTSGYGDDYDGPVNASHNFTNCTLINSTVTGGGSTGALIGHAGGNKATTTTINGVKVSKSTIKGEDNAHSGVIIGTAGVGEVSLTYNEADVLGGPVVGRFVPGTTGKLVINGEEKSAFVSGEDDNITNEEPDKIVAIKPSETAQEELKEAISSADSTAPVVVELPKGEFTLPNVSDKEITISGTKDTVIDLTKAVNASNSAVSFEGVTVEVDGDGTYKGIQHAEKVVYNNCTLVGTQFLYSDAEYTNCTFNVTGNKYNIWTYGNDVTFTGCTFNCDGKAVLVYHESAVNATVNFENCKFNDNGDDTVTGKAAVEVAESAYGNKANYTINMNKCTVNGFAVTVQESSTFGGTDLGTEVWGNKNLMTADRLNVFIDGKEVY